MKSDRFAPWLLVLVVLVVYLPGLAQLPLLDRDEPRFATAAREMMERDDWIVPTFNGNYRFDKPPLIYWLMRAGYAMAGMNELGARLPAVACMIALVLLMWSTGRRWFGKREGFAAAFMLATSLQFFIHGRLAVADMPMVLCVAVACVALAELLLGAEASIVPAWHRRRAWWSLWAALGMGFLAKGPIALLVPALALLLWRWVFWRKPLQWARLGIGRGLLLTTGIVAIWGIPALWLTHGQFWEVGIGEHVVRRGFEKFNDRSYSVFFYLGTAFVSLFPWIVFAGLAGMAALRQWDARRAWLVSWFVAPYIIFTAYSTQLPHYVLPGFPAFFLVLGSGFWGKGGAEEWGGTPFRGAGGTEGLGREEGLPLWKVRGAEGWGEKGGVPHWLRVSVAAVLSIVGLVLIGILALVLRTELAAGLEPLRHALLGLVLVSSGFLLVAASWWCRRVGLTVLGIALLATGSHRAGTGLRTVNPALLMSQQWHPDVRCLGWGFAEPSLVFYSGAKWIFPGTPAALADALAIPGPAVIVVMERECDPLGFFTGHLRWREYPAPAALAGASRCLQSFEGLNLGRCRWQRISVWMRPESIPVK
ncbi:MAG: glycosyltransferase family 39 protein [Verrucomicrobiota bacterium]